MSQPIENYLISMSNLKKKTLPWQHEQPEENKPCSIFEQIYCIDQFADKRRAKMLKLYKPENKYLNIYFLLY